MPRSVRIGTFERPRSGQLSPACCSDDLARDLLQWLGCVDHHGPETPISLLDDQAPAKGRAKLLGMLAELVRGPSGQSVAQGALVHDQAYHPIEEHRDTVLVLEPPAQLTDARENVPGERLHRVRLDSPGKLLQPAGGGPVRRIHDRFTRRRLTHQLKPCESASTATWLWAWSTSHTEDLPEPETPVAQTNATGDILASHGTARPWIRLGPASLVDFVVDTGTPRSSDLILPGY